MCPQISEHGVDVFDSLGIDITTDDGGPFGRKYLQDGRTDTLPGTGDQSDLTFEITDLAGNKCSTANDYNKQELFVSGTTGNKNNWLEEKDGKIVLKDIYVDKGFSANAFAALIRNNLAISVVIFVVIGLVLLAVIILPILSKKRKKMDAADAEKLN